MLQKKAEILASSKAMGDLPLPFPTLFISEMLADALFPLSITDRSVCTFYLIFLGLETVFPPSYLKWDEEVQKEVLFLALYIYIFILRFYLFRISFSHDTAKLLISNIVLLKAPCRIIPFWLLTT